MNNPDLMKRVEALEREVLELKSIVTYLFKMSYPGILEDAIAKVFGPKEKNEKDK